MAGPAARRAAAPEAVVSHRLNIADAFSYFDKSISPLNFLRYTSKQWRWLDSPLISQNRLRISDYRQLLKEAGFEIVREENTSGRPEDLDRIKLAPEFQHYRREDLLVTVAARMIIAAWRNWSTVLLTAGAAYLKRD